MQIQLLTDYEKTRLGERQSLPETYLRLSDEEMGVRLEAARAALGSRVAHFRARDAVRDRSLPGGGAVTSTTSRTAATTPLSRPGSRSSSSSAAGGR